MTLSLSAVGLQLVALAFVQVLVAMSVVMEMAVAVDVEVAQALASALLAAASVGIEYRPRNTALAHSTMLPYKPTKTHTARGFHMRYSSHLWCRRCIPCSSTRGRRHSCIRYRV